MRVPELPEGTRLSLRAGDWYARPGVPATHYTDVRVVRVYPAVVGGAVWVRGHGMECAWPSSDCTAPWCVEMQVRVSAIVAAADGLR